MTNNVQPMKGFRQPPKPTKGQVEKENKSLALELTQRLNSIQQFYGNLINQVMRQSKTHDQELNQLSTWLATAATDEAAAKGDSLLLDYAGQLLNDDGSPAKVTVETAEGPKEIPDFFDGGSGKLFMLNNLVGGTLIPGFEEQLVGLKAGEGREIEVQFPKEYGVESLREKKAKFTVYVHEVRRSFVNSPVGDLIDENQRIRDAAKMKALADAQAAAEKAKAEKAESKEDSKAPEAPAAETATNEEAQAMVQSGEAEVPAEAQVSPEEAAASEQAPSA